LGMGVFVRIRQRLGWRRLELLHRLGWRLGLSGSAVLRVLGSGKLGMEFFVLLGSQLGLGSGLGHDGGLHPGVPQTDLYRRTRCRRAWSVAGLHGHPLQRESQHSDGLPRGVLRHGAVQVGDTAGSLCDRQIRRGRSGRSIQPGLGRQSGHIGPGRGRFPWYAQQRDPIGECLGE
jgi:hypothetical protein